MNDIETFGKMMVTCRAWQWMPGMLAVSPASHDGATGYVYRLTEGYSPVNSDRAFPHLNDPATIGCVLSLIQMVYDNKFICLVADETDPDRPWAVRSRSYYNDRGIKIEFCISHGKTKAEALAHALQEG